MKKKKSIQAYTNTPIHQFWFEDGILHLWVNVRSGLYTIALNDKEELHFLADMDGKHKLPIEKGTVYEFKGIYPALSPERKQTEVKE